MQNLNILQQLIYCLIDCLQAKRFPLHCSICQLPCTALEKIGCVLESDKDWISSFQVETEGISTQISKIWTFLWFGGVLYVFCV